MSQRKDEAFVVVSFGGIIAAELLAHWFLKSDLSPTLQSMYLSNSKLNSITMLIDNWIPAAILGIVNGWVGYRWTTQKLNTVAVFLAAGITCSQSLYSLFFPKQLLWWWPPELGEGLFWFLTATVFAVFFSHLGRNFQITKQGRVPK
jgi:hypothetical protein